MQLLTFDDLIDLTKLGRRTLYTMKADGRLPPPIKFGRSVRWPADVIRNWLTNHTSSEVA